MSQSGRSRYVLKKWSHHSRLPEGRKAQAVHTYRQDRNGPEQPQPRLHKDLHYWLLFRERVVDKVRSVWCRPNRARAYRKLRDDPCQDHDKQQDHIYQWSSLAKLFCIKRKDHRPCGLSRSVKRRYPVQGESYIELIDGRLFVRKWQPLSSDPERSPGWLSS